MCLFFRRSGRPVIVLIFCRTLGGSCRRVEQVHRQIRQTYSYLLLAFIFLCGTSSSVKTGLPGTLVANPLFINCRVKYSLGN